MTSNKQGGKSASEAWRGNSTKRLLSFVIAIDDLGLITACQTTSTGANTASQKETLLGQAGFKWKTVTTPKQQERVSALPEGKVSAVKFKGRTYYVYPTATKDRILVGNQAQFNAYKQSLQAQRNQLTGPVFEEETHGPHPIQVQEFDGFGPLGE